MPTSRKAKKSTTVNFVLIGNASVSQLIEHLQLTCHGGLIEYQRQWAIGYYKQVVAEKVIRLPNIPQLQGIIVQASLLSYLQRKE